MKTKRKTPEPPATPTDPTAVKAVNGEVTGKPSFETLRQRISEKIKGDARWDNGKRGWDDTAKTYFDAPWVVDILVPDDDNEICAVIRTNDGKLVKHYFRWDGHEITMDEGESEATETTTVYSKAVEDRDRIVRIEFANDNKPIVSCREVGVVIQAKKTWAVGEPVDFQWMPGGVHVITASYGRGKNNRPIRMAVQVDANAAEAVQASFEEAKASAPRRPPYGCVEHRAEERAFDPIKFEWRDDPEPAIYLTAEPSELGARNVNGKTHTSFSPTFDTDADYHMLQCSECSKKTGKCECSEIHVWQFPDGSRGSESNPARVTRVDSQSVGSLTNWPAFKEILPIAARQPDTTPANPALSGLAGRTDSARTILDSLVLKTESNRRKIAPETLQAKRAKAEETLTAIKVIPDTPQQKVERIWARMRSTGKPLQVN